MLFSFSTFSNIIPGPTNMDHYSPSCTSKPPPMQCRSDQLAHQYSPATHRPLPHTQTRPGLLDSYTPNYDARPPPRRVQPQLLSERPDVPSFGGRTSGYTLNPVPLHEDHEELRKIDAEAKKFKGSYRKMKKEKRAAAKAAAAAAPAASSSGPGPFSTPPAKDERDIIHPPSTESGGVPEPTSSYLLRASLLPQISAEPRPTLVVIDLNGTLVHRPNRRNPFNIVERPNARLFLKYCIDTFRVVIWSSARPGNVRTMCEQLLDPLQLQQVIAIWGRDHFGLSPEDYNQRTQCYKRLTQLWADPTIAAAHPTGGVWNQGNTVLIDDSVEKARSEPYNAITLPEYVGRGETSPVLPLVHDYLNLLAWQADISTYIRTHPFQADRALIERYGSEIHENLRSQSSYGLDMVGINTTEHNPAQNAEFM